VYFVVTRAGFCLLFVFYLIGCKIWVCCSIRVRHSENLYTRRGEIFNVLLLRVFFFAFICIICCFICSVISFCVLLRGKRVNTGFSRLVLKRGFTGWAKTYNYRGYLFIYVALCLHFHGFLLVIL
jgi:hypothetical protein